ncbi:hypothetical protein F4859DRAFT_525097 [Xylaria cf. heliscus]|nr:hypothetical protein F4859DRAFT_525097 [Xylaria cf. heliscus]
MSQQRRTADLSGSGHLTIIVSMVIFVSLILIIWTLMGLQLYYLRRQRLADLEMGVAAKIGPIDGDVPLDNVLKSMRYSQVQSARENRFSLASSTATYEIRKGSFETPSNINAPRDSQWNSEERPISYFFDKVNGVFKKKKNEAPIDE